MLRVWQSECITSAIAKYQSGSPHFFCQATPGAGKTIMAAEVAKQLLDLGAIDLILCFSPSVSVAEGIKFTFSQRLECTFNGGLGSIGQSLTYQSILFLDEAFWKTIQKYRIFVVFDEIHHCSGGELESANVWGQQILTKIQNLATYTLALSGTPWRSDKLPIVMAEYSDPEGRLLCDYQYGLRQAINDSVCRRPKIVLVDNEHLTVSDGSETKSFSSILELLKQSKTSYQSVIHNADAMEYMLRVGCQKLTDIRTESPNAGGLIVSSSVQHAKKILNILTKKLSQSACIVTYHSDDPLSEIEAFRHSTTEWIVSVGMISEGTDIPRLQVCCHMSAVKTELYFRQVLGRILRINHSPNQEAWLFTFAEQNLVGFAERIEQDIPETCQFSKITTPYEEFLAPCNEPVISQKVPSMVNHHAISTTCWTTNSVNGHSRQSRTEFLSDDLRLGQFKKRVISAFV
ncbi:DEAD/DEAH box helicase [Vibrio splendidus]